MNRIIVFLIFILFSSLNFSQSEQATLNGRVLDSVTGKILPNCNIYLTDKSIGTSSDSLGYFTLALQHGTWELNISHVGDKSYRTKITIPYSTELIISLEPKIFIEKEVTVLGEKEKSQIEVQELDAKDIKKMPNIYGDVLRGVQVLAGVSTNNELSSGYNVRGGSFNENLIYLNGYEIYRQFLLRNGVEENQSLVNPDLVENIKFYNGAFPARYGDKMSSSLDVNYRKQSSDALGGSVRLDMLNAGISLTKRISDFDIKLGARYAYPKTFLGGLQTKGDYDPSFSDFQMLTNFRASDKSNFELFTLYAVNKFDMDPNNWEGHFGAFTRGDYQGVAIDYDGFRYYNYYTGLVGLKHNQVLSDDLLLSTSVSRYWTKEEDNEDIAGNIFYLPNPESSDGERIYLKTRYQFADNSIELNSYRIQSNLEYHIDDHSILAGVEYRIVDLNNRVNEDFFEVGDSTLVERPLNKNIGNQFKLNSLTAYIEDNIQISDRLSASAGLRYNHYEFTSEHLFSPRLSLTYFPNSVNTLKLSYGIYYQPPFQNELSTSSSYDAGSQRAVHYVLGWESKMKGNLSITAEAYYKQLDDINPFYFEDMRMIYTGSNNREGYAYGLDFMLRGEIVEGTKSWIGYSYLDTGEKDKGSNVNFQRRLLDQTHTIQIFLQDKMPKHPNWQSHLRFLLGSGYLYYDRVIQNDPASNTDFIEVQLDDPQEYFLFFRVDMGLSVNFNVKKKEDLIVIGEVLNVFDHLNTADYEWIQV